LSPETKQHKHEYIRQKETGGEEEESNINMCYFSANASTYHSLHGSAGLL